MTKKGSQSNSDHQLIQLLKDKLEKVEKRIEEVEKKNKILEEKVVILESEKAINHNVTRLLSDEVDRLDQYHRSNLIISNVIKPEHESQEQVNYKVNEIIQRDLNLPDVIPQIDKLHRVGKVRERNGKQTQDIIVRFRTHAARYQVYDKRKQSTNNIKIRPNLTKRRDQLRYEATELVKENEQVNFIYSDAHGDIKIRLNNQFKCKYVHKINSLEELKDILEKINV